MKANVGELRQQSAFCDADRPVITITNDQDLQRLLNGRKLQVVEFYPDTTDGDGEFNSTFKIKVVLDNNESEVKPKAFLVGTHRYSFKAGEPAEILGVHFVTPAQGQTKRACYHVRFEDGKEDLVPIRDTHYFKIISAEDVEAGRIPEVVS